MEAPVYIYSGRSSKYLAEKIARCIGKELGIVNYACFSDGEFRPSFEETVRGGEVFIIQSTFAPADNLLELLMMIDAANRASAKRVMAVIPYFGYARQDRKDKSRVPITSKLIANLLIAAGVQRIITMDLHSDQIQGFFDIPVDHLFCSTIFVPHLQSLNLPNLTVASPDAGGAKRGAAYAKFLNTDLVICHKQRIKENVVDNMTIIGDVVGKDIILVDDIVDTAGTLTFAADLMLQSGARSVRACITHPVLSGNAYEKIEKSSLTELIVANTIPLKRESPKITVLDASCLFAKVITAVHSCESISKFFKFSTIQ
ncbi:MAG: ribose-phosphate pyrophosphokinase [Bacteroidales bacterium]|nr:ribose-phosphate pyrophosphokinase [Bacteroidales bacterium]